MAKTKHEAGHDFPRAAFAYVPDPDQPSTWKLRLWETPDKKVTARQVGMAYAAITSGFRGHKAQLSGTAGAKARAKIKAAYRRYHGKDDDDEGEKSKKSLASYRALRRRLVKAGQWRRPGTSEELGGIVPHYHTTEMWPNDQAVRTVETAGKGVPAATEYRETKFVHRPELAGGTQAASYWADSASHKTDLVHRGPYHWDVNASRTKGSVRGLGLHALGTTMHHFSNPHDPEAPGLSYIPLHRGFIGGDDESGHYQYQSYRRENMDQHIYSPAIWQHAAKAVAEHPEWADNAVQVGPHLMPVRLGELADLPGHLAKMGDHAAVTGFINHVSDDSGNLDAARQRLHHQEAAVHHVEALPEPHHIVDQAWPVTHMVHARVQDMSARQNSFPGEHLRDAYRNIPEHLGNVLHSLATQQGAYHNGPVAPHRAQHLDPGTMQGYMRRTIEQHPGDPSGLHTNDAPADAPHVVGFTHFAPRHYHWDESEAAG